MSRRLSQRARRALHAELAMLKVKIRLHPIQVSYERRADMTLSEFIAAIKRRDEIEMMLG